MGQLKKNSEIKASAREYLLGNYVRVISVQFLFLFFSWGISTVWSAIPGTGTGVMILTGALTFFSYVLIQVLIFGLSRMYLKLCCRMNYGMSDLFGGLRDNRVVLSALLLAALQFVFTFPADVLVLLSLRSSDPSLATISLAARIVGMLTYYVVWLFFSQLYYVLLDFPDKGVGDCIKISFWLMKGQKLKLVGIQLSFLPLILLSILTVGVGMIWVTPYMNASYACFHLNLTEAKSAG
ncbi:MAG: DUF975 family protein [Lachnospiraceae bacterium]|nr:DUF975 family protein [Lachnospiraceae bacterium]